MLRLYQLVQRRINKDREEYRGYDGDQVLRMMSWFHGIKILQPNHK